MARIGRITCGAVVAALALWIGASSMAHAQRRPAGWIADPKSGCRLWNPVPQPDDRAEWTGPCVDGFADGKGTLRWFDGDRVYETDEGEFHQGKLNGFAVLVWTDGRRFEGQWRDQRPNGTGTLRTADGQVFSGEWTNGCFQQGNRHATQNATAEECGFR